MYVDGLSREYLPAGPLLARLENVTFHRGDPRAAQVTRAKRSGRFTVGAADELCVTVFKLHPAEVYGEAWWA